MFRDTHTPRLGFSMKSERYRRGEPVMLYVWAENPTEEAVPLFTCTDLESFKQRGFDVYDAKGRPLVRRKETAMIRNSRRKVDPCTGFPWTCTRDLMLRIEPQACVNGANDDFSTDLSEQYNLKPGKYTVHPRRYGDLSQTGCRATHPIFRTNPFTDITFSITGP